VNHFANGLKEKKENKVVPIKYSPPSEGSAKALPIGRRGGGLARTPPRQRTEDVDSQTNDIKANEQFEV
jgi:hypothetical protein